MSDDMAKGKKTSKGQRRDDVERKRDERCRRNALRKERKNKDDLELDENFTSFSNQLEAQGLKIRDIIGDGNCLFRALGDQLDGDHTTHARHRRETVQFMREHRQDFEPFMEDNISFEKHLKELSQLGTFGGNDSIVAFARNHGVNVVIHQLNEPRWVISGSEYCKTGRVIQLHISYHNGEHYSSVRSLFNADASGPAWPDLKDGTVSNVEKKSEVVDRKGKEKRERDKKKERTGAQGFSTAAVENNHCKTEAEQAVMEATGCKDFALIAQTLEENMYNVDMSISYVLQMMCVAEEQGFGSEPLYFCNDHTEAAADAEETSSLPVADSVHMKNKEDLDSFTTERTNEMIDQNQGTTQYDNVRNSCDILKTSDVGVSSDACSETSTQEDCEFVEKLDTSAPNESCSKSYNPRGARPKTGMLKPKSGQTDAHLSNKKRKELAKKEKKKNREERRKLDAVAVQDTASLTRDSDKANGIVADLGVLAI